MAYKFQSGDATLSGSVTLVNYQDLLFESDGVSDIGTAAKEARVVYTTRQTASVGISGSAVYANNFYGNGSGLTGVPGSTTSKITGSNQDVDLQLVLVQNAGTTETLAVDNAGAIAFNPSSNLLSSTGKIGAGTDLSASAVVGGKSVLLGQNGFIGAVGDTDLLKLATNTLTVAGDVDATNLSGSDALEGKSVLLGQNGFIGAVGDTDLLKLATNKLTVNGVISGSGAIQGLSLNIHGASVSSDGDAAFAGVSGSGNFDAGGTLKAAKNKFQVASDGDVTAVAGTFTGDLTAVAGTFTGALSGSSTLDVVGASNFGPANNLSINAAGVLSGSGKIFGYRGIALAKNKFVVGDNAGLVSQGNINIVAVDSKLGATEAVIATTDYLYFADANDSDKIKKDGIDDVMKIGMSLLDEDTVTLANDFLYFGDNADSNFGKRIKAASFIAKMADGTSITSSNGVLSVVGAQNIDIDTIGNASRQLTSAGMNYASASITTDVTYTLPASPSTGDIVYIKLAAVTSGKHAVISGSGMQLIDGVSTLTASSAYAGISLCYVASDVWRVF